MTGDFNCGDTDRPLIVQTNPTRKGRVLGIFRTNNTSFIKRVSIIPGYLTMMVYLSLARE